MFKFVFAVAASLWIGLGAGAALAADRALVDEFLEVTGLGQSLSSYHTQYYGAADQAGEMQTERAAAWRQAVDEHFVTDDLEAEMIRRLEAELSVDTARAMIEFYQSPASAAPLAAELVAVEDGYATAMALAQPLVEKMAVEKNPRLQLLIDLTELVGDIDRTVDLMIEMQVQVYNTIGVPGEAPGAVSEAEIRAFFATSRAQMWDGLFTQNLLVLAGVYRDVSDADMEAYFTGFQDPEVRAGLEVASKAVHEIVFARLEAVALQAAGAALEGGSVSE